MSKVRTLLLAALATGLAACGGSDSTGPEVATIIISPADATMDFLGSTVQFSARVEDQDGDVITGVQVQWASSDPSVASIDLSGRATALTAGSVQITASASGVTGQTSLSVNPAPCTTDLELEPGEYQILPVDCAISIPAGAFGDRYRVGVLNQNITGTSTTVSTVTLNVAELALAAPPAAAAPATGSLGLQGTASRQVRDRMALSLRQERHLRWAEGIERRTRAAHLGLRAAEVALMEAVGTEAVLPDLSSDVVGAAPQGVDLPAKLQLRANPGNSCTTVEPLETALLLGQNEHLAVYQDSAQNAATATRVTTAQAQRILDYYAAYGKSTIDTYYPGVPDVDGNGKVILYVSFDDALDDGATAAYVWGGDLLASNVCATSNEAELTYFNAALIRELDNDFTQAFETTVHEVKHISSFWHGIARSRRLNASSYQPSWLEEGSAEIAGNMSARRAWATIGGPLPNERLVGQDFRDARDANGGTVPEEAFGVILRLFRAQGYLSSQPNGLVVTPSGADDDHSVYGSGWTFLRWLGDSYGDAALLPYRDATFFASQNDSLTPPGIAGLEQLTGETFQTLLEQFALAAMFHMQPGEPLTGGYTSYDFVDAIEIFCFATDDPCDGTPAGPAGSFPWPVTATLNGPLYAPFQEGSFSGSIGPTGMRVHEFRSNGTGAGIALRVTAAQPAKVVVARVE
ncbi:MAG TPA: Ig-like domain-containing protein [Longimicrobiales bacterium]|nr:Ig-like domain-containing protein [Longimicrobiales bacterium]